MLHDDHARAHPCVPDRRDQAGVTPRPASGERASPANRQAKRAAQFGETVHPLKGVLIAAAIKTGQEPDVVQTGETSLEAAPEADRPRRLHVPLNGAFRLRQNPAENLNQRRLSLTISSKHRQASSLAKFERQVAENLVAVSAFE